MYKPLLGFKNEPRLSNCIKAFKEHPDLLDEIKKFYLLIKFGESGEPEDRHLIAQTTWKSGDFIHFTHRIEGKHFEDPYQNGDTPDGRDFEGQFAVIPKDKALKIISFQRHWADVKEYDNINDIPARTPKTSKLLWHGGNLDSSRTPVVTYFTDNKEMAESYVDMSSDRFGEGSLEERDVNIHNPAPWEVIRDVAQDLDFDEDEIDNYTPASIFDAELFGDEPVARLVNNLRSKGYDGAILDDIGYGVSIQAKAYIVFNYKDNEMKRSKLMGNKKKGSTLYAKLEDIKSDIDDLLKWDHVKDYESDIVHPGNLTSMYRVWKSHNGVKQLYIVTISVFDDANDIIVHAYIDTVDSDPVIIEDYKYYNSSVLRDIDKLLDEYDETKEPENVEESDKEFLKSLGIKAKKSKLIKNRQAGIELDWDPQTRREVGKEEARASSKIYRDLKTYVEQLKSDLIQNGISLGKALSGKSIKDLFSSSDYTERSLGNKLRSSVDQFLKKYPEKEQNFFKENYGANITDILSTVDKTSAHNPQEYDIKLDSDSKITPEMKEAVLGPNAWDGFGKGTEAPDRDQIREMLQEKYSNNILSVEMNADDQELDILNSVINIVYSLPEYQGFFEEDNRTQSDKDDFFYFESPISQQQVEAINNKFLEEQKKLGSNRSEPLIQLSLISFEDLPESVSSYIVNHDWKKYL